MSIHLKDPLDPLNVVPLQAETGVSKKELHEMFVCLFDLEKSGVTQITVASTYLHHHFELNKNDARSVVSFWINNYKAIKAEHDWKKENWGMS